MSSIKRLGDRNTFPSFISTLPDPLLFKKNRFPLSHKVVSLHETFTYSSGLKNSTLERVSLILRILLFTYVFQYLHFLVREMLWWTRKDLAKDYISGFRKLIYQTYFATKSQNFAFQAGGGSKKFHFKHGFKNSICHKNLSGTAFEVDD